MGPLEYDIFARKLAVLLEQEFLEIFANCVETPNLMEYKGGPRTRDLVGHMRGIVSVRFKGKPAQEPTRVCRNIRVVLEAAQRKTLRSMNNTSLNLCK
jgi:hypothetical protein